MYEGGISRKADGMTCLIMFLVLAPRSVEWEAGLLAVGRAGEMEDTMKNGEAKKAVCIELCRGQCREIERNGRTDVFVSLCNAGAPGDGIAGGMAMCI